MASLNESISSILDSARRQNLMSSGGSSRLLSGINRFGKAEPYEILGGIRGFIFFTKPSLHIYEKDGFTLRTEVLDNCPFISYLSEFDLGKEILSSLSTESKRASRSGKLIPLLTNRIRGFNPPDDTINVIERGETWHGSKVITARENIKSRSNITFGCPFIETKDLLVMYTMLAWQEYMEKIDIGLISPDEDNSIQGIVDYASTYTYIVTGLDVRDILYWERGVGVIPNNSPSSLLAWQAGNLGQNFEGNLSFNCALRQRPMNPIALYELNQAGEGSSVLDIHKRLMYVGPPLIVRDKTTKKYQLDWRYY